jgi:nicotinamidase-related amidase
LQPASNDRTQELIVAKAGVTAVNASTYDKSITALLVVDPYNDFISEGGKIWPRIKAVAEANNCVPNMLEVLNAARNAKLRVFYAMHHRYRPGDYETWRYIAPIQRAAWRNKSFEYGTWRGEIRAEFAPQPGEISDLFLERARSPEAQNRIKDAVPRGFQTRDGELDLARMLGELAD